MHSGADTGAPWALPERYMEMMPVEQADALRAAILAYLKRHGRAAKSVIMEAIQPPRPDTFQKALDYLAITQTIYVDQTAGSRDPVYFSNGQLAHATGQVDVACGPHKFVIRSYDDRLAGKRITVTQYAQLPSNQLKPVSGISFDWQDLPRIIEALSQVADGLKLYGSKGGNA